MSKFQHAIVAAALFAAGCSSQDRAEPADDGPKTVHEMMTKQIDPDADAIWAIGNAAIDEQASIDPSLMSDEDWDNLRKAAERMTGHARELASLDPVRVTRPGVAIADEGAQGAPSPARIQAHLDRDTDVYRALAESLASHVAELAVAAREKDAPAAGRLINEMDGVCESCHLEFWYPEQKPMMREMGLLPE